MDLTFFFSLILLFVGLFLFARQRLFRYLQYFQQEDYDPARFFRWLVTNKAFDRKGSLTLLITFIATLFLPWILLAPLCTLTLIIIVFTEEDPRKSGKIRLKMTERATRIYRLGLALFIALVFAIELAAALFSPLLLLTLLPLPLATPFFLVASRQLLQPGENRLQQQFLNEAKQQLASVSPFLIGITGSYGKTSAKDALSQILQITLGPTFWPAKGVNTPMGITREIRAHLAPEHRYAVIEMGAYGIGSIKRLCDLTPPQGAIITTIGTAHLERFGSRENIRLAKSELAQALPKEGILVCNGDDEGARSIAQEFPSKTTLLYGFDNHLKDLACWVSAWHTTHKGTVFTLHYKDKTYEGFTPLFGQTSLANILGAFLMACALGSRPEYALAVIRNLEPVSNRLQVEKIGDVTYIHDAYNSNPRGFEGALQILKALPGERKILMTPGMIELGHEQESENERVAEVAGSLCDLAIVVGETNRKSLVSGLQKGGLIPEAIIQVPSRDLALKTLAEIGKSGDLILIENDLPDLYEATHKF